MLKEEILTQFTPINLLQGQFLSEVAQKAKVISAQKGTIIFKRSKIVTDCFFLIEGEVDLIDNDFGVEKVKSGSERSSQPLNLNSPTAVSAIAKSPIRYFSISSDLIERLVAHSQRHPRNDASGNALLEDGVEDIGIEVGELNEAKDWMSCLLHSPLFSRIPMTLLQELFSKFDKIYVRKGDNIVKEGARGDYFYVLASGGAKISNRSGGVDVVLKEGDYFGEEALISQAPRNATVTMTSDGILKRLNADDFMALVKEPVLRYFEFSELSGIRKSYKVIDVRLPIEYRAGHVPESINVPLSRLRESLSELGQGHTYVVAGEAGARADIAAYILCQAGFDAVILKPAVAERREALSSVS